MLVAFGLITMLLTLTKPGNFENDVLFWCSK